MNCPPDELDVRSRYKLMIGCIVPRPIALVSTVSHDGIDNVAPFSFFAGVGANPMTLVFCPANGSDGQEKDTLRNAKLPAEGGTGEFVVNVATETYARRMAGTAESLAAGESEFELVGLTPEPSVAVRPPRVLESPVAFECRTLQVVRTNPGVSSGGNMVIGEVVHIHVAEAVLNDRGHVDPDRLAAIGRMGGLEYCRTRDRFELPMGVAALHEGGGDGLTH